LLSLLDDETELHDVTAQDNDSHRHPAFATEVEATMQVNQLDPLTEIVWQSDLDLEQLAPLKSNPAPPIAPFMT